MTGGSLSIEDVRVRSRYEASIDGAFAGWVEYRRMGIPPHPRLVAVHTEVLPEFGGRGIATALVRRVIADARAAGVTITPRCPLFRAWFDRHPEDADLVAAPPARTSGD